jgi:CobQ-like glutamine amidotransferase family enzyme
MVHLVHLFPQTLGLFGDSGNVLALRKRCEWRGISVRVTTVEPGELIPANGGLYLIGTGSSSAVRLVGEHIRELRDALTGALSQDASILAVGAGMHLLSDGIAWADGSRTEGAGIITGESRPLAQRQVGEFVGTARGTFVAGFVNTGHTLDTDLPPHITDVSFGAPSPTGVDGVEFGTVIGTHSHGSYLPMNPEIADDLVARMTGTPLDSTSEFLARANRAAEHARIEIRERIGR